MALTPEQMEKVQRVLGSDGWRDVMKPALVQRRDVAVRALIMTRSERASKIKGTDFDTEDDVLRAMIADCEWLGSVWDTEAKVAMHNQRLDELEAANPAANP